MCGAELRSCVISISAALKHKARENIDEDEVKTCQRDSKTTGSSQRHS